MHFFPVTWTATGSGSVQRNQNGQTFAAQWNLSPASTNGSFVVFVRASDNRLIFHPGHTQLRADFALRGMKQGTWNGAQQQPGAISYPSLEWQLAWMDSDPTSSNPSGSFSVNAEALPAELANPPDLPRAANCAWHFSKGGSSAQTSTPTGNNPAGNPGSAQTPTTSNNSGCLRSSGDIIQDFASMKADIEQQFDRLIQEATDPATKQSLQQQRQQTLQNLAAQEQRDLQTTSQGCPNGSQTGTTQVPSGGPSNTSTGNTGSTSTPTGSNQNSAGNTQITPTGQSNNGGNSGTSTSTGSGSLLTLMTASDGGTGSGTITTTPAGTSCGANCGQYSYGTIVTLAAVPANGSSFVSFKGGGCGITNPCSLTITASTVVTSAFSLSTSAPPGMINVMPTQVGTQTLPQTFTMSPITAPATTTPTRPSNLGANLPRKSTTTTPAPKSGNYLVRVNGLLCTLAASSSDAVYVGAAIRQYDRRNMQITMSTNADTWVYGDVNNMQGQRKQAGTRSQTGGIGTGDMIPPGFAPGAPGTLPAQPNLLPLLLWQGTLTDGVDAVVISPSVWENYGDRQLFYTWHQNEQSFNNTLFLDSNLQSQISNNTLAVINLGSSTNSPGSTVQGTAEQLTNDANTGDIVQGAVLGGPLGLSTGLIVSSIIAAASHPGNDRPFGLVDSNSTTVVLPNATLVLTREMIEKRLGSSSWTFITINFNDTTHGLTGGDRPGAYTMFIEIDRQ